MLKLIIISYGIIIAAVPWNTWATSCELIRYATNPNYPPYGWAVNHTGYDGASVDLLRLVLPEGIKIEPVVFPWKRSQRMAETGQIDLLLAIRPTPDRQKYLVFTQEPAFPNPIVLFSRIDSHIEYHQWKDLKGWRGGKSLGDAFGYEFDKFMDNELSVEDANSADENFKKLTLRRIDYFLTGYYLGLAYLKKQGMNDIIKVWQPPLTQEPIFFAFSSKSPCIGLIPKIDQRLRKLSSEGTIIKLLDQALARYQFFDLPHELSGH